MKNHSNFLNIIPLCLYADKIFGEPSLSFQTEREILAFGSVRFLLTPFVEMTDRRKTE
jgi:hypothetical protein